MDINQASKELDKIIERESLTPFFQPIVSTQHNKIYGYEALIRGPSLSALHSPVTLFQLAAKCGRLVEVDMLARKLSIYRFKRLGLKGKLFLNIMPLSLMQSDFHEGATLEFLQDAGIDPNRVVIEINEQPPINDYELMRHALSHYRGMGFKVALDDLGDGSAGLRHWSELAPDYVKTSRYFCQQIENDSAKHKFMEFLIEFSRKLGCEVIIEGVERLEEYQCLWGLNSNLLQGYYFSHPAENPPREIKHKLHRNNYCAITDGHYSVMSICQPREAFPIDAPVYDLMRCVGKNKGVRSIAVTEDDVPVGIINRDDLLEKFANPYAHSLYGKKTALELCQKDLFMVRESTGLEDLSRQITDYSYGKIEDVVVVDAKGRYLGMASVMDLLREITTLQVKNARQSNPLTGLPGNNIINNVLSQSLASSRNFVAIYCDLDNFKPFNDKYGHARGDGVIMALADLLRRYASGQEDFVGHVGGDDFMLVMMDLQSWQSVCKKVLADFENLVPTFYDAEHRGAGGMWVSDRQGREVFAPMLSVSMAALPVAPGRHGSPHEISTILCEVKHKAKEQPGNSLFIDRRNYLKEERSGSEEENNLTVA